MTKHKLLERIKEALQREENLSLDMKLKDIKEWDSLGIISIIALYDQLFSIVLTLEQLNSCKTVEDVINLVGDKIDEK
jgi:acyl carrier protein